MKEDPKLKAAFELKKKIEEDLGIERKSASNRGEPLIVQVSSYNLDFGKLETFDDLYNFADYNVTDEKIAALMETSTFEKKEDFILFLRKEYDKLIESLQKRTDVEDKYNLFLAYMSSGRIKEALSCAVDLKNEAPALKWGYLALSHILFFLGDERWREYFKVYLSMTDEKLAHFVWKVFNGEQDVRFPRMSDRKYLLNISLASLKNLPIPKDTILDRICSKPFNVCSDAMCKIMSLRSGLPVEVKKGFCYLEDYLKALLLYTKGKYREALLALPKLNDPSFIYLEALCHYSLDEADGFNAMMKEISKVDRSAFLFISLSNDAVEAPGLAEESSIVFRVNLSKIEDDYYTSLRKLIFEVAKMRGYPPSRVNFGMKMKRYHIMRMFFGYRSCKGVRLKNDKK